MANKVISIEDCTVPEKILLAANQLEESGQTPFSAEALIVMAWQKYPRTFGLKGFVELYPDSNKILASIMGEKGLARRGWLVKTGLKMYALTKDGSIVVKRILQGEDRPASRQSTIRTNKETDRILLNIMDSIAFEKFQDGRKQEVAFTDACKFFSIQDGMSADQIDAKIKLVLKCLQNMEHQIGLGNAVLSTGQSVAMLDVVLSMEILKYLEEKFSRHFNLLKVRAAK